ncbi:MAG: GHKL domain-containing protein [Lachnospiraceae bacterium]|nr:GHKL domain-containing protein [Lachnospiraceae bacterium]
MIEYIKILIFILLNYGISMGCHLYLAIKACGGKWDFVKFIYGFGILYILFCIPYLIGIKDAGLISYILQIIGLAGYIVLYYKKSFEESIGISAGGFVFVYMFIKSFFITSSKSLFNQLVIQNSWNWTNIVFSVFADGVLLLCVFLFHKKDISIWISNLYRNRNKFISSAICFYVAIWIIVSKVILVRKSDAAHEKIYFLIFIAFIIGLLLLLFILAVYYLNESKNEKIKMQEFMIIQQNMYITTLERLQIEIKKFQHDYKNIVAGLYTVEKNNDTLKFLEENILRFDEKLSASIMETASLSHIKLEEVKGVVLTKMIRARENGVLFFLEVIKDIESVYMNIVDFNRCLGILIDNGIEAAKKGDKKEVHVVMIWEETKFVLIVKNTYKGVVQIKDIWKEGYSTKGEQRGIGLNNYNEILSRYPCVTRETQVEESYFIQILKSYPCEKGGFE